ncbi:MAG TPA: GIY-YIG nuclease family protein [Turneriella sp.]|nr:GIY-YIG nuclease family protein [Turneriella sp.]
MGFMYILECCDGSLYTGSTKDLKTRLAHHEAGDGANYTKKRLPVTLIYAEEYDRIDHAFAREKQIQGWRKTKKLALIDGNLSDLNLLAKCRNVTFYKLRENEKA